MQQRWKVSEEFALNETKRYLINENNCVCYIITIDNKPIGTGIFDIYNEIDETLSPWNSMLYIEPEYRGNDFGQMLVQKRLEWANEHDFKEVYLDTYNAKDYHLKFGWQIVKQIETERGTSTIMKYKIKSK
jgi:N-acetylglutamate synthase-like GNAT family acetyltransferase